MNLWFFDWRYNRLILKFLDLGYMLVTQSAFNCVFLSGTHWVEIAYRSGVVSQITSVYLDHGQESPAPLNELERKLCEKILKCMKHLNR